MKITSRFSLTIQIKFILCFIVFLAIPLIVSGLLIYGKSSALLYSKSSNNAYQKLQQLQAKLDSYLHNIEALSFDISFNPQIQDSIRNYDSTHYFDDNEEYKKFRRIIGTSRLDDNKVFYLKIFNKTGNFISTGTMHREEGYDDTSFNLTDTKHSWMGPYKTRIYQTDAKYYYLISLYRKVVTPDTIKTIGSIRIDIDEENIREIYSGDSLNVGDHTLILDGNNKIISSMDSNEVGKTFREQYQSEVSFKQTRGDFLSDFHGIKHLFVYDTLETTGWKIIILYNTASFNRDSESIKTYILFIAAACFIFSIMLFLIFSHLITKPIKRLISTMKDVEKGNFDTKFRITTKDEISQLGSSFNDMVSRIKELIQSVFKIQQQEKRAESLYLQSQINPHFLYNTLDSIRWLARYNNDFQVSEQIEALSSLLKHLLIKGSEYTTFHDELEHVKNYMFIQTKRFEDRISYKVDFDEEILSFYSLKLILQPLVENSIIHGLENKTSDGYVQITGKCEGDEIMIHITDNGTGISSKRLEMIMANDSSECFAINNIQTRIRLHFGDRYGLKFESQRGSCTKVTLRLPILKKIPEWGDCNTITDS